MIDTKGQSAEWWAEQCGRYKEETVQIQHKFDALTTKYNELQAKYEEELTKLKMTHKEYVDLLQQKQQDMWEQYQKTKSG